MTRLKDILRATIIVSNFFALRAVHSELEAMVAHTGKGLDLTIVGLKNRYYKDDAGVAGYRDW